MARGIDTGCKGEESSATIFATCFSETSAFSRRSPPLGFANYWHQCAGCFVKRVSGSGKLLWFGSASITTCSLPAAFVTPFHFTISHIIQSEWPNFSCFLPLNPAIAPNTKGECQGS